MLHLLLGECSATVEYLAELESVLEHDFPKSTGPAAFLVESIQGAGGTVQFTRGYLPGAFEAVRRRGGVCISDEVLAFIFAEISTINLPIFKAHYFGALI